MSQRKEESLLGPYRVLDLSDEKGVLCGEVLGLSKKEIAKLEADEIIGKAPLPEADSSLRPEPGRVRKKAEEMPSD